MPLVIFNYYASKDGDAPLDHYKQTLKIPRHAMHAKWTLESINAVYYNDAKEDFKHLEVEFPELMGAENFLYNTTALGNIDVPEPSFRFYTRTNALSQQSETTTQYSLSGVFREFPVFGVISEYPQWPFGNTRLETEEISIVVSAREGNVSSSAFTKLSSFSIILSYE